MIVLINDQFTAGPFIGFTELIAKAISVHVLLSLHR
jgi:hypothetical protein